MKDFKLYVILDKTLAGGRNLLEIAEKTIEGGADVVQLRDKKISNQREFIEIGRKLKVLTERKGVLFIVNDRVDLALAVNAQGVHLGQDDFPLDIARLILGKNKIIGISTHNLKEATRAEKRGADYIGIGPIFKTSSKREYASIGPEIIEKIKKHIRIPFVAIGGINCSNVDRILSRGAKRIAVGKAIVGAEDVYAKTKELKEKLQRFNNKS